MHLVTKIICSIAPFMLGGNIHIVQAQSLPCANHGLEQQWLERHPEEIENLKRIDEEISSLLHGGPRVVMDSHEYLIPVVVHVLHLGESVGSGTNISDAQIHDAMRGLNERFANVIGSGVNTNIQFQLATRDPLGCPTTGINRVTGRYTTDYIELGIGPGGAFCHDNEQAVKDLSRWPVLSYYNIWVVSEVCNGGANGFSEYPSGRPDDGAVVAASSMTFESTTLTHEVAHGFFLFHTFEQSLLSNCPPNDDCMLDGDRICDTPPHWQNECSDSTKCTTEGDWDNSRYNYLSYCSPDTMNGRFTEDQKQRMLATLQVYPRLYLLHSSGLQPPDSACVLKPFVSIWDTSLPGISGDDRICFPGIGKDYSIVWQLVSNPDIKGSAYANDLTYITLPVTGIYKLQIFPLAGKRRFSGIIFNYDGDRRKLINIEQWGDIVWENMENAFYGCTNLNITALDTPNMVNVASTKNMFRSCSSFNGTIGHWNTSHVWNMEGMFQYAPLFNQDISAWNTGEVKYIHSMFEGAKAFNQDIGSWDVKNVILFDRMFGGALAFNQDIGAWNTEKARSFREMFANAQAFNQDIGAWNTTNVTDLFGMFSMATSFNQDISAWDISHVKFTRQMFSHASSFNQDLSQWNTSSVITMEQMFSNASSYNYSLGDWKLNPTVIMEHMLNQSGMDCIQYSATLNGWQVNNPDITGRTMRANSLRYGTNAVDARNALIQQQGWTIIGDQAKGEACEPCAVNIEFLSNSTTCGNNNGYAIVIATGGASYEMAWDHGSSSPTLYSLPSGTYTVTVTAGNGCSAVADIIIEDSEAMDIQLDFVYPDLFAQVAGGKPPLSFSWNTGDTSALIQPGMDGYYLVTVTDSDGCTMADSIFLAITSTTEPTITFNIYPNPSDGDITFEGTLTGSSGGVIAIYNYLGQKLIDEPFVQGHVQKRFHLDRSGLYIYIIRDSEGGMWKGKVVVER